MVAPIDTRDRAAPSHPRAAWADNLKVTLVAGVIVAHATMAWTGVGTWVLREPPLREPLLSLATVLAVLGALFGMALFFLIAGFFTPASLARKGAGGFLIHRSVRLAVPMVFFALVLSPVVEYADPDNAGWARGFPAFVIHVWWPPVPGPTWFLGVLLLFSALYALIRTLFPPAPQKTVGYSTMRIWHLVAVALGIAITSYAVRLVIPLGVERWHLALGQAPAWVAGFGLGALGAERGWFAGIAPQLAGRLRLTAWTASAALVLVVVLAGASGSRIEDFGGGGTWQSLAIAVIEGVLVVAMSLWLLDLFQRRLNHQGVLWQALSRAAFAAFVVHQIVLVGLVLGSRHLPWPPEIEYPLVSAAAVAVSFAIGALVVRMPGLSRVV